MFLIAYCAWCRGSISHGWRLWLQRAHLVRWTGHICRRHLAQLRTEVGLPA